MLAEGRGGINLEYKYKICYKKNITTTVKSLKNCLLMFVRPF